MLCRSATSHIRDEEIDTGNKLQILNEEIDFSHDCIWYSGIGIELEANHDTVEKRGIKILTRKSFGFHEFWFLTSNPNIETNRKRVFPHVQD